MNKNAVIIFARNAVPGKVKTRLARSIGDVDAFRVYMELCTRIRKVTDTLECTRYLYYSDFVDLSDTWNNDTYIKRTQVDGGLGRRMQKAFSEVFSDGYSRVLLIGTDIYGLTADIITSGFKVLADKDMVLGPAKDGGYYLVGMRRFTEIPFRLKRWSHPDVLRDTLEMLGKHGIESELLEELKDIDVYEDLRGTDLEALF